MWLLFSLYHAVKRVGRWLAVTSSVHGFLILGLRTRKIKCMFQVSYCLSTAFMLLSLLIQKTYLWVKRETAREAWERRHDFQVVDPMDLPSVLWPLLLRTWKRASWHQQMPQFLCTTVCSHKETPSPFTALSAMRTSGLPGVHGVDLIREESSGWVCLS